MTLFYSEHASLIWDRLYTVLIPDHLTMNPDYVRKFGVPLSGNKQVDAMMSVNFTTVKINVARILEYFIEGIEIQIPSRADMIQIHKDIEAYLTEWKDHIKYDINLKLGEEEKRLILSLERLSKKLYDKAIPREVIDNLFLEKRFGIVNPLQEAQIANKEPTKMDYEGISQLVKRKVNSRFGWI